MKTQTLEELGLEPSWACSSANSIRWHQVGSMPVREYFPIAALEDTAAGVTWAVELTHGSSWQLEAYRRDSGLSLSGGLADRECGHWMKRLYAGESFTARGADGVCRRRERGHAALGGEYAPGGGGAAPAQRAGYAGYF